MGYDANNKTITAPVNVADIAMALGEGSLDVGTLCVSDKVNMWAKNKPIPYPTFATLTDAQRKGTAADNRNNIFYGIRISGLPTSAVLDARLADMHNVTFERVAPSGGSSSPFRVLDFDGYKHNATANPSASFASDEGHIEGFYNDPSDTVGGIAGITVTYRENEQYGVDFAEILTANGVALSDTLAKAYPCILITDGKGQTYFTALSTTIDEFGTIGPSTLIRNGDITNKTWFVKMGKSVRSATSLEGGSVTPPWTSAQTGMKATLFLLESIDANAPLITKLGDNFHTYWIKADGLSAPSIPVALPNAIGLDLELKQYFSGIIFQPTAVIGSVANNRAVFGITSEEITGGTSDNLIGVTMTLHVNGVIYNKKLSVNKWPSLLPAALITTDFLHVAGTTYSGKVTITTVDGTASNTRSMNFSTTIN